jgi:hypothetical protein
MLLFVVDIHYTLRTAGSAAASTQQRHHSSTLNVTAVTVKHEPVESLTTHYQQASGTQMILLL